MPPEAQVAVTVVLPVAVGLLYIYRWEGVRQGVGWLARNWSKIVIWSYGMGATEYWRRGLRQGQVWAWAHTLLAAAAVVDLTIKERRAKASKGAQVDSTLADEERHK